MSEDLLKRLKALVSDLGVDPNVHLLDQEQALTKLEAHAKRWSRSRTRTASVVELCVTCNGQGTLERSELVDYHKGDYNYSTDPCHTCGGSGRVRITTVTLREPLQPLMPTLPKLGR